MELAAVLSMKDPGVVKHGWHQRFFTFDALRGERKLRCYAKRPTDGNDELRGTFKVQGYWDIPDRRNKTANRFDVQALCSPAESEEIVQLACSGPELKTKWLALFSMTVGVSLRLMKEQPRFNQFCRSSVLTRKCDDEQLWTEGLERCAAHNGMLKFHQKYVVPDLAGFIHKFDTQILYLFQGPGVWIHCQREGRFSETLQGRRSICCKDGAKSKVGG